jgi:hypothetical protein
MSESEDSVQHQKKRPIVPRAERARRSLSWFMQAAAIEGWDRLPEWTRFQQAGFRLLSAIERGST